MIKEKENIFRKLADDIEAICNKTTKVKAKMFSSLICSIKIGDWNQKQFEVLVKEFEHQVFGTSGKLQDVIFQLEPNAKDETKEV